MALQKILVDQMGVLTLGLKTQIGQNILATGQPIAGGRFPFLVWMISSQNSEGIQPSFVVEEVELVRKPGIALIREPEMGFWSEFRRNTFIHTFLVTLVLSVQIGVFELKRVDEKI